LVSSNSSSKDTSDEILKDFFFIFIAGQVQLKYFSETEILFSKYHRRIPIFKPHSLKKEQYT